MSDVQIVLPGDPVPGSTSTGTYLQHNQPFSSLATSLSPPPQGHAPQHNNSLIHTSSAVPYVGATILGRITRTNAKQANLDILAITNLPPSSTTTMSASKSKSTDAASSQPETYPLPYPHPAILRQQDIRLTNLDKTFVQRCFSAGDIIRAKVISLGDERAYYVSTAGDELGVVLAWTRQGRWGVGLDWTTVGELRAGAELAGGRSVVDGGSAEDGLLGTEERKVARIV